MLEKKLQQRQFHTLAVLGRILIRTSDANKQWQYFNQPWLKFTGRTFEQKRGIGWTENVHPKNWGRFVVTYDATFQHQIPPATPRRPIPLDS